jgi:hypothetical protein
LNVGKFIGDIKEMNFSLTVKNFLCEFNCGKLFAFCVVGLYGLSLFLVLSYCYYHASFFNSYPYDGPFQTLYSLRKISDGQLPGRDFYFFHGNGIPFIHYPIYQIFGENLFSSSFSESLIHVFFVIAPLQIVTSHYYGRVLGMLSVVLWILISTAGFYGTVIFASLSVFQPLSTFGIRSVSPVIVAFVLAHIFHAQRGLSYYLKALGLMCFFSPLLFLLGTEHGIYTLFTMYVFVIFLMIWKVQAIKGAVIGVFFAGISLFWLVASHLLLFGNISAFHELLNLVNDQAWYFGVYPHLFIADISELLGSDHPQYRLYRIIALLTIFTICVCIFAANHKLLNLSQVIFLSFLFIEASMGLTSNLGYVSVHYAAPILRALFIAGLFLVIEIFKLSKNENIYFSWLQK